MAVDAANCPGAETGGAVLDAFRVAGAEPMKGKTEDGGDGGGWSRGDQARWSDLWIDGNHTSWSVI